MATRGRSTGPMSDPAVAAAGTEEDRIKNEASFKAQENSVSAGDSSGLGQSLEL